MTADSPPQDGVSVLVLASDSVDETAATLRSLLGQSEPVEVLVLCSPVTSAELTAMWGTRPPAGLVILPTPPEMTSAQRAAIGCEAAQGALIGFAPAGLCFHPRHFAMMQAAATSAAVQGGVCLRLAATETRPLGWIAPPVRHAGVTQLLEGSLAAESLLVSAAALRACGGPVAEAGDAWLFALALGVAIRFGLDGTELPEPARPSLPTSSPAMLDAGIARWLQGPAMAATVGPSALIALQNASADRWPLMRRAVDEAARRLLASMPLRIGTSCRDRLWQEQLCARLPRAGLRHVKRSGKPLALLAKLATESDGPAYVMLTGDAPPDIDQLVLMCLRMESDGLDACLAFMDDGLLHAPTPDSLLHGTLFRRARLVEVLSAERIQDEHRFWTAFAVKAAIGAAGRAAPRRPEPRSQVPLDTSIHILPAIPAASGRSGRFDAVRAGVPALKRLYGSGVPRFNRLVAAWTAVLLRKKPDPVAQLVDAEWYGRRLPGGLPTSMKASDHYRRIGWREGVDPNPFFPTTWYLENNPDVRQLGICPLEHYVAGGAAEMLAGRMALPLFDPVWYARQYGTRSRPAHAPLVDLVRHGASRGWLPHPLFVHEAVCRHLEKVEPRGRGEEMRRLWDLREALSREPHAYTPACLPLLSTVLVWRSPPGVVPEVRQAGADSETAVWHLRAVGESIHLSVGADWHVIFAGASRHRALVSLLTAAGARFDRLSVEQLG